MPAAAHDILDRVRRAGVGGKGPDGEDGPVVLELDLTEPLLAAPASDPVEAVRSRRRLTLAGVLDGLRRASDDRDVAGIVVQIGGTPCGLATAQELRAAVAAFRATGRFAVAWSVTFGEFGAGTPGYYLATVFDEIWLQESGDVGLIGVAGQVLFLHDALDRAGIDAQVGQRHEYKNAANMFTRTGFTEPHREAVGAIVDSFAAQLVDAVGTARGLRPDRVRELVDASPLTAADAHAAGLIDRVGYRDEVYDAVRERAGGAAALLFLARYRPSRVEAVSSRITRRKDPQIALIYGIGTIRTGRTVRSPLGGPSMGSDTIGAALRAAVEDDDVVAIVLRVDSPGGSYVASDSVRREVLRARAADKPVIVSMGEVAGSGGYFIAMAADVIVANPATITGSIGVLGGKAVVERLLDRVGIGVDAVARGARALMFSPRQPFSEDQRAALDGWLDRVYDDFTAKVAADRGLSRDCVHELARGRIWSGADAHDRGLVDELGGLADAVRLARERAGLAVRMDHGDVRVFPKTALLDRVRRPQSSEDPAASAAAVRLDAWGQFAGLAAALGLPAAGPLHMPFSAGGLVVR